MQKAADDMRLIIMNLKNDGGPNIKRRRLPERWHQAYEGILAPLDPDLVAVTEFTYSQTRAGATWAEKRSANRRFKAAQDVLQSHGFRAEKGQGRNSTGMFVRKGSFILDPDPQRHYTRVYRTPPTHAVLRLPEVPHVPINAASHHAPYCNPLLQTIEGYELTSMVDKVKAHHDDEPDSPHAATWLFGDWNQDPWKPTPGISWNSPDVTDVVHRCHRARKLSDGPDGLWVSRTAVDELMMDAGMHDAARFAAMHCGQPHALDPTAGFARSARGQGGLSRIDRGYLDGRSVQAVKYVRVLDMNGISDHHIVLIVLSRRKLVQALLREFPSLNPWDLAA
ncbi:endonuclease/exonuclease/phosphatase family protein [Streptomyces sp. NBC_00582]|uniref:endonuclease/exonuclease/phosphatase family protein n=1 Tax=Streptomyces sp. NBC_00582 TaxID=2975783 RepID=UPI002E81175C|nr:endonuclease/exonuclease/phosphatase family protein [Streptomyces sp. NBC_00582]WUB68422.1 endonuclease/exonuclease/phosphatase family protein [Streptomyces sp. NBC_00582]